MDFLPLDIENIILDYKNELEFTEKYDKIIKSILIHKKYTKIIMCKKCGNYMTFIYILSENAYCRCKNLSLFYYYPMHFLNFLN